MRTSLEEGIKLHRFAGIFPKQSSTVAGRHREAVVSGSDARRGSMLWVFDALVSLWAFSMVCGAIWLVNHVY
jgi:hypothetical protein